MARRKRVCSPNAGKKRTPRLRGQSPPRSRARSEAQRICADESGRCRKVREMTANQLSPQQTKTEEQLRREICTTGRCLYDRGLIAACEGNLSARLGGGRI